MLPIAETELFVEDAKSLWTEFQRLEFITWIATNPLAGDVIPGSGGCRKVRWARAGLGKRGGVRVIYLNRFEQGTIWLLERWSLLLGHRRTKGPETDKSEP